MLTLRTLAQQLPIFALLTATTAISPCRALADESPLPAVSTPSIWTLTDVPQPLGFLRLAEGETGSRSLRHALGRRTSFEVAEVSLRSLEGTGAPSITYDPERLRVHIDATEGTAGVHLLDIALRTSDGRSKTVTMPILIRREQIVTFSFVPPENDTVTSVSVAGAFNGWSDSVNRLELQEDGTFAIALPIPPGTWTYKLVVDGNWIPDPLNPQLDGTEFNNSVLIVQGDEDTRFRWRFLPGERAFLPTEAIGNLRPESIQLILNNQLVAADQFLVSEDRVRLGENLALTDDNWAVIIGADDEGRQGSLLINLATSNAARTPADEIIYFTFTDRFHNGDPSNDRDPATQEEVKFLARYLGGDWAGIKERINDGYLSKIGATTLWLSPVVKNTPNVEVESIPPHDLYTSYHGYWPIDSKATNPHFGTMEELRELVFLAHANGMAVLLDFVSNHVHVDHPLFQEIPDLATPQFTPEGTRNLRLFDRYPLSTWFDDFIPSIDFENNPRALEFMTENAVWWMEQTGADGYRHDAVKHVPDNFWTGVTDKLEAKFIGGGIARPFQIGETISNRGTIEKYVDPEMLDGQFDFPLYFTIADVLGRQNSPMSALARSARESLDFYSPGSIMSPLLGNHDVVRIMTLIAGDGATETRPEHYRQLQFAFAALYALPGPPALYYGDEIGLLGGRDPDNRRPMIWENWTAEQQATADLVSELGKLRQGLISLRRGDLEILHADQEILVLGRTTLEERTGIILARRAPSAPVTVEVTLDWYKLFTSVALYSRDLAVNGEEGKLTLEPGSHAFAFFSSLENK